MGKNARVKWKSRRKFSQSRTFHSYPIGLHIIFSTSSCAKLAVYLVWWVASFLFKFLYFLTRSVTYQNNATFWQCMLYIYVSNFLTMLVTYLSILFMPMSETKDFYFIYLLPLSPILETLSIIIWMKNPFLVGGILPYEF